MERIIKFKRLFIVSAICFLPAGWSRGEPACRQKVTAEIIDNQVVIAIDGDKFTCYKFAPSLKKPYFWPVMGPLSQKSVTAESSEPYPHHNSLFFGCDRVNGGNYWQEGIERGQIISQGPQIIISAGEKIVFTDECLWKQPSGEAVIRDWREITVSAPRATVRYIDFDIGLEPLTDIQIEKNNHSLFAARMAAELSVNAGGVLVNAQGNLKEAETFGVESPWCDYYGVREGITEGLAILQHPSNRWFPDKWFTRDYGFMSPTSFYWPKNGQYRTFARGEILSLRYRIVVHAEDTRTAGIPDIFQQYKKSLPVSDLRLAALMKGVESYKFGQSRKSLIAVANLVNDSYDLPQLRNKLADNLAKILSTNASYDSKKYVCEQLSLIGTAKHIPQLARLLPDEQTSDIARYALERMSPSAANDALGAALAGVSGRIKVGIVNSLGRRGDKNSVKVLTSLMNDADDSVVLAAIEALSKIDDQQAAATLGKVVDELSDDKYIKALDAYLLCADRFFSRGEKSKAAQIYSDVYQKNCPPYIQAAALKGLILSIPDKSENIIKEVLAGDNLRLQAAIFETIRITSKPEIVKIAAAYLPNLSPLAQIQFLTALPRGDDPVIPDVVTRATKSSELDVRIAAIKALAQSGSPAAVMLLARTAATAEDPENHAARESLVRISGPGIDEAILKATRDAGADIKCELITAIAERRMTSGGRVLLQTAQDENLQVRLASIKALRFVVDETALAELVNRLIQVKNITEKNELERTLAFLAAEQTSQSTLVSTLLEKYAVVERTEDKCSILNIVGRIKGPLTLSTLKDAIKENDPEVRKSALKGLSDWSDAEPAEALLKAAKSDPSDVNRILALRGYINLVTLPSDRSAEETVGWLAQAMETAGQSAEKKFILGVLPSFACEQALKLATSCLDDNDLRAEAELALKIIKDKKILMFDFQPRGSPVTAGYIEVNPSGVYDDQVGYGWQAPPKDARDRIAGTDLSRDFIFDSAERIFQVKLPNGIYVVSAFLGDMTNMHDQMEVYVGDALKIKNITTQKGQVSKFDFGVTVTNGMLNIKFKDAGGTDVNWTCAGLHIR